MSRVTHRGFILFVVFCLAVYNKSSSPVVLKDIKFLYAGMRTYRIPKQTQVYLSSLSQTSILGKLAKK
jgi:hypothetical protein